MRGKVWNVAWPCSGILDLLEREKWFVGVLMAYIIHVRGQVVNLAWRCLAENAGFFKFLAAPERSHIINPQPGSVTFS